MADGAVRDAGEVGARVDVSSLSLSCPVYLVLTSTSFEWQAGEGEDNGKGDGTGSESGSDDDGMSVHTADDEEAGPSMLSPPRSPPPPTTWDDPRWASLPDKTKMFCAPPDMYRDGFVKNCFLHNDLSKLGAVVGG